MVRANRVPPPVLRMAKPQSGRRTPIHGYGGAIARGSSSGNLPVCKLGRLEREPVPLVIHRKPGDIREILC